MDTKRDLTVVPRQVIRSNWESGGGREVVQGGVRAVEVIVMEIEREERGAVVTEVVRAGVSPLTSDGLDEAFGLAICLSAIGSGKEMADAQLVAGGGEEPTKSYPPLACGRGGLGLARPTQ